MFCFSWCLELQFNRYKLLLFLRFIIRQLLFFGVLVVIFASLIFDLFVCIDSINVHWSWNLSLGVVEIFYEPYTNRTYIFASPAGLCNFVLRVPVGCLDFFTSIDWFAWYKIYFKFFIQSFFCWFLSCFIIFIGSAFIDHENFP